MAAVAKRIKAWSAKLTPGKQYPLDEALNLVKEFATAKFPESIDAAVNLGIDRLGEPRVLPAPILWVSRTWPRRSRPERSISTS
jgi:large subunit ribosomal protein L1